MAKKKKKIVKKKLVAKSSKKKAKQSAWPFSSRDVLLELSKKDKKLGRLIPRVGEFLLEPEATSTPFEYLMRSIVFQQLAGQAARTILGRVLAIYGDRFPKPKEILRTKPEKLRSAGLSQNKMRAILDLAEKTETGVVPDFGTLEKMHDEEIISALTQVRGVGRWTVEMLLIFRMGRADVLPVGDYALRKSAALLYGLRELPKPKEFLELGERWRPYRTVVSWYLWRALDLKD